MRQTLRLPYPPSANNYWRYVNGRVLVSREARSYKTGVKLRALTAGWQPLQGPVCVFVTAFRPRRIGDLENTLAVLLDGIQGAAYENDSQIVEIHAFRMDDATDPRIEVTVMPFEPEDSSTE